MLDQVLRMLARLSDEDVRKLQFAVKAEAQSRSRTAAMQFAIGEEVMFAPTVTPAMLAGRRAVVVDVRRQKVVVDLREPVGRWARGVRCHAGLLLPASHAH
jgi:hypothetical protein